MVQGTWQIEKCTTFNYTHDPWEYIYYVADLGVLRQTTLLHYQPSIDATSPSIHMPHVLMKAY